MARIGDIQFSPTSISEDSAVKYSTHEVAIYPKTFGEIYKVYGATQRKWCLTGSEAGGFNVNVYRKLERLMRLGLSVPIDLPEIGCSSIGFITSVKLSKMQDAVKEFQVDVAEGLYNPINNCDGVTDWISNGTLAVDTSDFKEGKACVKAYGSQPAAIALYVQAPITVPPRFLLCDWIAFWLKTDNITDLTSINVKLLVDANNYASINVASQVTEANKWILIRFKRADMTLTGSVEWSDITAFRLEKTHSTAQTYAFWLDDICAYQ